MESLSQYKGLEKLFFKKIRKNIFEKIPKKIFSRVLDHLWSEGRPSASFGSWLAFFSGRKIKRVTIQNIFEFSSRVFSNGASQSKWFHFQEIILNFSKIFSQDLTIMEPNNGSCVINFFHFSGLLGFWG